MIILNYNLTDNLTLIYMLCIGFAEREIWLLISNTCQLYPEPRVPVSRQYMFIKYFIGEFDICYEGLIQHIQ